MLVFTGPENITNRLPRSVKAAGLGVSLLFSALLTAVALRAPEYRWLAWISFLPLLVVVRSLRPRFAALAGGLWGVCLYVFCIGGPAAVVDSGVPAVVGSSAPADAPMVFAFGPSAWLLALLIVIPAIYVGFAARASWRGLRILRISRAIGPNILLLALGWTLLEAVFHLRNVLGPHDGLLTGSQADGPHLHWLARLLGYVCTAFLVAFLNAALGAVLSSARLSLPQVPCRNLWRSCTLLRIPETHFHLLPFAIRALRPRAPPAPGNGVLHC